jgi:hypothetical protein
MVNHFLYDLNCPPGGQSNETFYERKSRIFVMGKPFQLSILFVGKARSLLPLTEAPQRCFTSWVGSCLTCKHNTILERLVREEYFSLLRKFVTYSRKTFYNIGPRDSYTTFKRKRHLAEWVFDLVLFIDRGSSITSVNKVLHQRDALSKIFVHSRGKTF